MKQSTGAKLLIGTADTCPDLEYLSGFHVMDPVVLLAVGRNGYLIVPQLEFGRAKEVVEEPDSPPGRWEVLTPEDLNLDHPRRRRISEWAVALLRREGIKQVKVASTFPCGVAKRLRRARIRVDIADGPLCPQRAVKRVDEVQKIRDAQQAAVIAMRDAIAVISKAEVDRGGYLRADGSRLTCDRMRRIITGILLEHNCFCREIIVVSGRRSANPHEKGSGAIRAGDPIVIDIFPQHLDHGYWGDLTRTVVKGRAAPEARRMYRAVKAAQKAALDRIRPGVKCRTVHRAAVEEFTQRRYRTTVGDNGASGFIHGTGHGVGLAIHEAPSVAASDTRLRSGNVITVEPGLYYPEIGGIRIEDTIVVTTTGWRYLVPCEKRFEL